MKNKDQLQKINYFPGKKKKLPIFLLIHFLNNLLILITMFSITENPSYLPAIFSLCVMGILQDDETLTAAALQELAKVSIHVACKYCVL